MIVAISGTPGTGKTEVAKRLARKLGWMYVSLNELAEEEDLYKGHDSKRMCDIVDIEGLRREVSILGIAHKNLVLDSHYSHEMPCDFVVVLRTGLKDLRERMVKKGFWREKIKENLQAEIMDVVKEESLERGKNVYEMDTTKESPEETVERIMGIIRERKIISSDIVIPDGFRNDLRKSFGKELRGDWEEVALEVKGFLKDQLVITVGDASSYSFLKAGIEPDMIIIDGKEKRKPFGREIVYEYPEVRVSNPPGGITLELWKLVENLIPEIEGGIKRKVIVEGEEDLAVLPCVIFAPEGSLVFYGLFDRLVRIEVTRKKKDRMERLLERIVSAQPRKRRAARKKEARVCGKSYRKKKARKGGKKRAKKRKPSGRKGKNLLERVFSFGKPAGRKAAKRTKGRKRSRRKKTGKKRAKKERPAGRKGKSRKK